MHKQGKGKIFILLYFKIASFIDPWIGFDSLETFVIIENKSEWKKSFYDFENSKINKRVVPNKNVYGGKTRPKK